MIDIKKMCTPFKWENLLTESIWMAGVKVNWSKTFFNESQYSDHPTFSEKYRVRS